jgi:hypothetical protein
MVVAGTCPARVAAAVFLSVRGNAIVGANRRSTILAACHGRPFPTLLPELDDQESAIRRARWTVHAFTGQSTARPPLSEGAAIRNAVDRLGIPFAENDAKGDPGHDPQEGSSRAARGQLLHD